ncbi:MAG: hypothetical protein K6D94_06115 [Clostridiales bacterium]|nr:hypothetical protein [Clostridiales bacterium]
MKTLKRLTSVILLAALLAASLAACGGGGESAAPAATGAPAGGEAEISEAEAGETENAYIPDGVPDADLGGAELKFLTTTWYEAYKYIYAFELDGEVINDALYNQRMAVQDRFNVTVSLTAEDTQDTVSNNIHKMVLAGDDTYDLIYNHDTLTAGNGMKGDFINLRGVDGFDWSKPWYKGTSDTFTIGGKLFFTANSFALSGIYMNSILTINKRLAEANGIAIPYDKAREGTWYFDDLIGMTADMNKDIDGDGKMTGEDQYGYLTSYYCEMSMQAGFGGAVVGKNGDGWLAMVPDETRIISILEKCGKLFENGSDKLDGSNEGGTPTFIKGNTLMCFCEGRCIYTTVRNSDVPFGIMPIPKFDETQENYASAGFDIYWAIPVPAAERAETTAAIVSAMSCYNYNTVVPQVWELVLGSKLSDSPDDADMFAILRDCQYVDVGFAFSGESGKISDLCFLINKTDADQAASYIEKRREGALKAIDKINAKFEELDG